MLRLWAISISEFSKDLDFKTQALSLLCCLLNLTKRKKIGDPSKDRRQRSDSISVLTHSRLMRRAVHIWIGRNNQEIDFITQCDRNYHMCSRKYSSDPSKTNGEGGVHCHGSRTDTGLARFKYLLNTAC